MIRTLRHRAASIFGGLSLRTLLKRTWEKIDDHEILTRASAVAFYAMSALVPFLGLILTATAQLLPDVTDRSGKMVGIGYLTVEQLEATLKELFPREAFDVIEDQIARIQKSPPLGFISIGLAVTLWLASSLYVAIIDAMNRIHGVVETRSFFTLRLTAIVMTLIEAAILIGSLVVIVAWPQIVAALGLSVPAATLATIVQWFVVTIMVLLSFSMTFYVGPDMRRPWQWITPGSAVGTVVFLAETLGLRIYVQHFAHYDKTYGSLGGVMVLMFWFWLSSVVLLGAAELNKIIEDASPPEARLPRTPTSSARREIEPSLPETAAHAH